LSSMLRVDGIVEAAITQRPFFIICRVI